MDPFEIDQDDRYGKVRQPEGRVERAKRLARIRKSRIVRRAIGKPKK